MVTADFLKAVWSCACLFMSLEFKVHFCKRVRAQVPAHPRIHTQKLELMLYLEGDDNLNGYWPHHNYKFNKNSFCMVPPCCWSNGGSFVKGLSSNWTSKGSILENFGKSQL